MSTIRRLGVLLLACMVFCLVAGVEPALTATNPFTPAAGSPITVGAGVSFVATGDLNGDGKPDVVAVNTNANTISVLIATGGGSFLPAVNYPTGSFPNDVVIADVTGSGKPDLIVTNSDGTIDLFINNGAGIFTTPIPPLFAGTATVPEGVAVADFNGDGRNDIVVADSGSNTVTLFLATGLGTFTTGINVLTSSAVANINSPSGVAVGDFNGDGKLDLATSNNNDNTVSVLLGNGNGTFQPPLIINVNPGGASSCNDPDAILVADFNRDSKADIAVACTTSSTVSILLGNGNGTFATPVSYTTFDSTSSAGLGPESIAAADFDGKNGVDLAIADSTNSVVVLLNTGSGTFTAPVVQPAGKGAFGAATADFNADNKPDLAVANSTDGTVSILLNAGNITSSGGGGGGCTPSTCPANFSITISPTTVTTKAGTLVTYTVTVTPGPGFSEPVGLTCASGAPASGCSFSSKSVLPKNGASVNSSLSVATNFNSLCCVVADAVEPSHELAPHSNRPLYAMLSFGGAGFFGLVGLVLPASRSRNNRRRLVVIIMAFMLLVVLMALLGCGVGKSTLHNAVTPPGTYVVTVTGTAGSGSTTQVATASTTLVVN